MRVSGAVVLRQPRAVNERLATGAVEARVREAAVLNAAKTPPFEINQDGDVDEALRRVCWSPARSCHVAPECSSPLTWWMGYATAEGAPLPIVHGRAGARETMPAT